MPDGENHISIIGGYPLTNIATGEARERHRKSSKEKQKRPFEYNFFVAFYIQPKSGQITQSTDLRLSQNFSILLGSFQSVNLSLTS